MAIDRITDVGLIAEKNNYGFWVESGELELFNQELNKLINNPDLIEKMGNNGYKHLTKYYTVERSYDTIMSHFS
jgi:glycosyltransferase involved in cell wall biosynthesis